MSDRYDLFAHRPLLTRQSKPVSTQAAAGAVVVVGATVEVVVVVSSPITSGHSHSSTLRGTTHAIPRTRHLRGKERLSGRVTECLSSYIRHLIMRRPVFPIRHSHGVPGVARLAERLLRPVEVLVSAVLGSIAF